MCLQRCLKGRTRDAVELFLVSTENDLKRKFVKLPNPPREGRFETYLTFSNVNAYYVITMELLKNIGHMTSINSE